MLNEIQKRAELAMPILSLTCTGVGLFLGRNFIMAAGCEIRGVLAKLLADPKAAEWSQISNRYVSLAKKDAKRDLIATAAFLALGFVALVGKVVNEPVEKPEKSGYFQNYVAPACHLVGIPLLAGGFMSAGWKGGRYVESGKLDNTVSDLRNLMFNLHTKYGCSYGVTRRPYSYGLDRLLERADNCLGLLLHLK